MNHWALQVSHKAELQIRLGEKSTRVRTEQMSKSAILEKAYDALANFVTKQRWPRLNIMDLTSPLTGYRSFFHAVMLGRLF